MVFSRRFNTRRRNPLGHSEVIGGKRKRRSRTNRRGGSRRRMTFPGMKRRVGGSRRRSFSRARTFRRRR